MAICKITSDNLTKFSSAVTEAYFRLLFESDFYSRSLFSIKIPDPYLTQRFFISRFKKNVKFTIFNETLTLNFLILFNIKNFHQSMTQEMKF